MVEMAEKEAKTNVLWYYAELLLAQFQGVYNYQCICMYVCTHTYEYECI